MRRLLAEFHAEGGDGIEVVSSSHTAAQYAEFATLARAHGLRASSGSDYHGPDTDRAKAFGRVGPGPWYDFNGVLLARDLRGLLPDASGRPSGAAAPLNRMFRDENGEEARVPGQDNHDTLTGSDRCGRLYDDGENGAVATCNDWTSKTVHGREGNLAGVGGQIPVGHSWPRAFGAGFGGDDALGARWIDDHTISGCEPGYDVNGGMGAPPGDFRVGAGGGYGGFYCFALGAAPPS